MLAPSRVLSLLLLPSLAASLKVTVLGGTGFVGSRVVKRLALDEGATVTSVSKTGRIPDWCRSEDWAVSVKWLKNDFTRGSRGKLADDIGSPDVLISCVGTLGFDRQGLLLGNGVANVEAMQAAREAGTSKYVLLSVASEVAKCEKGWLPPFMSAYFQGKATAEEAVLEAAGSAGRASFIKPSFIYGGEGLGAFGLFPPRVSQGYGDAVAELLGAEPVQKAADKLPGLLKVALRPPSSVDAVAAVCVAAAMGRLEAQVVDGTAEINAAAGAPAPTGLSKLAEGVTSKFKELTAE